MNWPWCVESTSNSFREKGKKFTVEPESLKGLFFYIYFRTFAFAVGGFC